MIEQAQATQQIVKSATQMRKTAKEVSKAVNEQGRAAREIIKAAQSTSGAAKQVRKASNEQATAAKEIYASRRIDAPGRGLDCACVK